MERRRRISSRNPAPREVERTDDAIIRFPFRIVAFSLPRKKWPGPPEKMARLLLKFSVIKKNSIFFRFALDKIKPVCHNIIKPV